MIGRIGRIGRIGQIGQIGQIGKLVNWGMKHAAWPILGRIAASLDFRIVLYRFVR